MSYDEAREKGLCLLNPCNVVAQLVTSLLVTGDLTLTCFSPTDVLGQVGSRETARIIHCAQRFCTFLRRFPLLHGSGAVILDLGYGFISGIAVLGFGVAMASTQEVEMLRRQLNELTAQMMEMRQQSSSTAMDAAVTGLTGAVRTMGP